MDGSSTLPTHAATHPAAERERLAAIIDYYTHATADYQHWSPALQMHFGYWRWPLSLFARAPMLALLSAVVHERLALGATSAGQVLDLGCGVGSSARQLVAANRGVHVLGLTITPQQVELGTKLSVAAGVEDRVKLIEADYRAIPMAGATAIGAYAIESACYDPEGGLGLIREAARVLEPGARLVVADAFRRRRLPRGAQVFERRMAAGWVLPGLASRDRFIDGLRGHGFELISCEDVSWRVLPSLLQVPLAVLGFRLRTGVGLHGRRLGHVRASLWSLACAVVWPRRFGYFIVTARRCG
jgi:cyclopropane fatty-acyl-phospholipid synthase-like methyltransferase